MSKEIFHVSDVNPNDAVGGGGCLCSEGKTPECEPPYVIFYSQEMASNLSPHAVVCARCVEAASKAVDGEVLSAGEPDPEPADDYDEAGPGEPDHAKTETFHPGDEAVVPDV